MSSLRIRLLAGIALLAFAVAALALRLPDARLSEGLAVFAVMAMGSVLPRWDKIDLSTVLSLSVSTRWLIAVLLVLMILATAGLAGLAMGFGLEGALIMVGGSVLVAVFLYVFTRLQRSQM